ncbi:MAG TPA: STAS domain-containing protein [Pseudonocardia sp.]
MPPPVGQIVVLRVAGEIDLYTDAPLRTMLAAAVTHRLVAVVVDLAGVNFCGGAGFGVLADTALRATVAGGGFAVTGLSPMMERHANLVWIQNLPVRYPGIAQAVRAFRDLQPTHHIPNAKA